MNPGQNSLTSPPDYYYSGSTSFTVNPFAVAPPECTIIYSCDMIAGPNNYDLCNSSGGLTTTTFDVSTGNYSFKSIDFPTFGAQTITFNVTGSTFSASDWFTFSLNLQDPCAVASIMIDSKIINPVLLFVIGDANS